MAVAFRLKTALLIGFPVVVQPPLSVILVNALLKDVTLFE